MVRHGKAWQAWRGEAWRGKARFGKVWQAGKMPERRKNMVYQWKPGARIGANPQTAGELMERLEQTKGLTAETLLDESRPEDAPLHSAFEWDDSVAAENYRLSQSRHIINCITICTESQEPTQIRAFFNTSFKSPEYKSIVAIMQDEDEKELLFKKAMSELISFEQKYKSIRRFSSLFCEIDNIKAAM